MVPILVYIGEGRLSRVSEREASQASQNIVYGCCVFLSSGRANREAVRAAFSDADQCKDAFSVLTTLRPRVSNAAKFPSGFYK